MKAKLIGVAGTWRDVADAARTTVGMEDGTGEPSSKWKMRMLLAEHSPIRLLQFTVLLEDIKSWVSVHLVRHKIGIEHFVRTQRTDRTGVNRDDLPQSSLVDHRIHANAQALIAISRKRLCMKASEETRMAWIRLLMAVEEADTHVAAACVPDCVYRGWCNEIKTCGFAGSVSWKAQLVQYRKFTDLFEKEKSLCLLAPPAEIPNQRL